MSNHHQEAIDELEFALRITSGHAHDAIEKAIDLLDQSERERSGFAPAPPPAPPLEKTKILSL